VLVSAVDLQEATRLCVHCPTLCLDSCPVSTVEANDAVSPWAKMTLARWLDTGQVARSPETTAVLYKCTQCGACRDACKHGVNVADALQRARQDAVKTATSPLHSQAPHTAETGDDTILPPGVSGVRLYAAGQLDAFLRVARDAAERWRTRAELVFASAEDARCVADIYPLHDLAISLPIRLASATGSEHPENWTGPVAYHESCQIRTCSLGHGEVILKRARTDSNESLVTWRGVGTDAICCGAAAPYGDTSPEGARQAARRVLERAIAGGAKTLVTGCAGCAQHMKNAIDELPIEVVALGNPSQTPKE
jgi:Fe-S oxidoreductase